MKKFLVIFLVPLVASAQKDYPALLDAYMQSAVTVNGFNGAVLVAKSGRIIYQKTVGYRDYDGRYRLGEHDPFELGVMAEQLTAAGIMLLKDRGLLQLSDPITKYFPALPYPAVTLHHLLCHTSGLPDYYEIMHDKWSSQELATNADIIQALAAAKAPLLFTPGRACQQSYTNYPLLAAVIEKVTGKSYAVFMQEKIFTPLHLSETKVMPGALVGPSKSPSNVEGIPYDETKRAFIRMDSIISYLPGVYVVDGIEGGMGIRSSIGDRLKWCTALRTAPFLSAATRHEMLAPHALKDTANKISYSYGSLVGRNELGDYILAEELGNTGNGFIGSLIHYTKEDITIAVLTNKTTNSALISGTLAYILYDKEVVPLYVHKAVTIDSQLLDRYVGVYALPDRIELVKKSDSLFFRVPGEPDMPMLPESPNKFFSTNGTDMQMEFVTDASGRMNKVYFISRGLKKEVHRL